jgi:deoxyribose-phosphate aldolase
LSALIKNCIITNLKKKPILLCFCKIFNWFYRQKEVYQMEYCTKMIMILENASPLPVKAAGGVRTYAEAAEMILGVKENRYIRQLLQMEKEYSIRILKSQSV